MSGACYGWPMKPEPATYYIMTCDVDLEDRDIRDTWVSSKTKSLAHSETAAIREAASEALDGGNDGDEIVVVIATNEDGSDAKRYTMALSIEINYDFSKPVPVDMTGPPIDGATGEPVKGLQDNATLPLFG